MRQEVIKILDAQILRDWEDAEQVRGDAAETRMGEGPPVARASAIGHELRQPLFTIAMASENLRQMLEIPDFPRDRMTAAIDRIDEQVQRAQVIIANALERASGKPGSPGYSDLGDAMRNSVRFLDGYFEMAGVSVEQPDAEPHAKVALDRIQAEQVFVNVLRNAVDSIQSHRQQGWRGQGRITIGFRTDANWVYCTIADNGAGLAEGASRTMFQPFSTTKPGQGNGLGLYISQSILEAVHGSIELRPGAREGAILEIRLPLSGDGPTSKSGFVAG